jgi:hypothetical protein
MGWFVINGVVCYQWGGLLSMGWFVIKNTPPPPK